MFLRGQHRAVIESKEESILFNPCVFEPPQGEEGYRRKGYFKESFSWFWISIMATCRRENSTEFFGVRRDGVKKGVLSFAIRFPDARLRLINFG